MVRRALLAAALCVPAMAPAVAGDAAHGKELYESRCGGCHSLDANRVGPAHRGVYGRTAGTAPNFSYSTAVKNAGFAWDEARLDQWLAGPGKLLPGSKMGFSVADPADRADIIAYLKSVSSR